MQFRGFVKQHNCACRGACRSHTINRQYKRRTDAASAVQWALTTWNYSLCSWKVAFYSCAPGNGNKGWDIHWIMALILIQRCKWQKGGKASIWADLSPLHLHPIYKEETNAQRKKLSGEINTGCKMIHVEIEACDTSAFGLSKNHRASEELILCCAELCAHACGPVLSSLNSCEAGCRWKMSQVLRGDINHWWTDTSEKKDKGRARREQTTNTLWHCWVLTLLRSGRVIAVQPSRAHPSHTNPVSPEGEKGYDATYDGASDDKYSHFPETLVISCT